jgi:hypothetical protein
LKIIKNINIKNTNPIPPATIINILDHGIGGGVVVVPDVEGGFVPDVEGGFVPDVEGGFVPVVEGASDVEVVVPPMQDIY